ncbi:MAG TPA: hypothetical protein VGX28_01660 [Frankiaceae bacterium]|jgi:hypothetical protein|nr:hypothetical protein [Frankiaceae bacterium]
MTTASLRDEDVLVYRFDSGDGGLWLARQLAEQWLRDRHVRSDAIPDLLLAINELCTGPVDRVVLRGRVVGDGIEVEVETSAPDVFTALATPLGDLRLAAAVCDEVVLKVLPERTVVVARRHGVVLP